MREGYECFRQLAEALPEIVWSVSADGELSFGNHRWRALTNIKEGESVQAGLLPAMHPDDRPKWLNAWVRARHSGKPYQIERRLRSKLDGEYRCHRETGIPVRDTSGRVVEWVVTALEVGDPRHTIEDLQRADRRKDEFLAMLAHEMRNPLTTIEASLQLLELAASDPAAARRAREILARQTRLLARLVDDLVDVTRTLCGRIELHREIVELSSVIEAAIESVRPLMEARNHRLTTSLPEGAVKLDADAVRLTQVLSNLLVNAAKYTNPGGCIRLSVESTAADLLIRVRDNGIGISPAMLPRVFEMFVQADPASKDSMKGLGIGLALARQLVELHGGSITASSDGLGLGSEFVVRMPL